MAGISIGRYVFPSLARVGRDGLLAYGADLTPETLLDAYRHGIFPWYSPGDPVLWWCPDPRCILYPASFHINKRSERKIRNSEFFFSVDQAFSEVIHSCASPRSQGEGTWLLPEMIQAYSKMHQLGYAHSIEIWKDGNLVGGLYGIALGSCFFGESMFHSLPEASRAALLILVFIMKLKGFTLLDCQQPTPHMLAMGAEEIPRAEFLQKLELAISAPNLTTDWAQPHHLPPAILNIKLIKS